MCSEQNTLSSMTNKNYQNVYLQQPDHSWSTTINVLTKLCSSETLLPYTYVYVAFIYILHSLQSESDDVN